MTEPDDRYGDALRRALRAEADRVSPQGDGLQRIRARTARRPRPWWQPALVALSAAAVVGVGAGAAYTVFQQDGDDNVQVATSDGPTEASTSSAEPTPDPTTDPSTLPSTSPTSTGGTEPPEARHEVFAYYLGDTGVDIRLFREVRDSPDPAPDRLTAAVETMLSPPLDRDYVTLWPEGTELVEPVTVEGDTATVNLSAEATEAPANAGADAEAKSVQQLVYTVTASGKEFGEGVTQVRLLVEGEEVNDLWGHGTIGEQPLTRATRDATQSLNWILSPQEGSTVPATFRIGGYSGTYEGNVVWQILDGETVVEQGAVQLREQGVFEKWASKPITLDPGTYIVKTIGGFGEGEGSETFVDTKTITVE